MGGFQGLGDWYHHPEKNKNSMSYEMRRDKKKEYMKEYNKNNKEKNKQWCENNKESFTEYQKEYRLTPKCKKSKTISSWKRLGLKLFGYTYDEVYEYYLDCDNCEVCNEDISMGCQQKNMDHCHSTGIFRWVLCPSCNTNDNWMNKI